MSKVLWVKLKTCLPSSSFCLAVFQSFGFPPGLADAFWAAAGRLTRATATTERSNNLVVVFIGVLLRTLSAMGRVYPNGRREKSGRGRRRRSSSRVRRKKGENAHVGRAWQCG